MALSAPPRNDDALSAAARRMQLLLAFGTLSSVAGAGVFRYRFMGYEGGLCHLLLSLALALIAANLCALGVATLLWRPAGVRPSDLGHTALLSLRYLTCLIPVTCFTPGTALSCVTVTLVACFYMRHRLLGWSIMILVAPVLECVACLAQWWGVGPFVAVGSGLFFAAWHVFLMIIHSKQVGQNPPGGGKPAHPTRSAVERIPSVVAGIPSAA